MFDSTSTGMTAPLLRAATLARRPELLAFVPAITLGAFWIGGEAYLLIAALGIPLLMALVGSVRAADEAREVPLPRDGVTGLPLRAELEAVLDRALERGMATTAFVVTLELADDVRTRHGQAVYEAFLRLSAERLVAVLRAGDLVARLDGPAFAVALAPGQRTDLETMLQLAARMQAALSVPAGQLGVTVPVSVSIGFCLSARAPLPEDETTPGASLLGAAQSALDEARRQGPGALRAFTADMTRRAVARADLRSEVEQALENGDIRPHFQPQICTDTGALSGMEALARWHHPTRGLVSPHDFLPSVIAAGLSERLCETVVFQSLTALRGWQAAGQEVPTVAINFGMDELRNPRLAARLKWELDRFELKPSRLTVEVMETVVASAEEDVMMRNLAELREMGCGIDLDDFGTGHASITAIRRFGVQRIKIDRSFVTCVDSDREQQRVVAAILSMAEPLGLDTLAEGVETPGEHAMLAQLGCRHVQGFGIARPMPVDEVEDWLKCHAARRIEPLRLGKRIG